MKYPTVYNSNDFSTDNSLYPFINSSSTPRFKSNDLINLDFNCIDFNIYKVSTTSNIVTATLPSQPVDGSSIYFSNNDGSFSANKFVINGNGNSINYSLSNYENSNSQALLQAIFDFKSNNWYIVDLNKVGGGGGGVLNFNEMYIGNSSNVPISSTKSQISTLLGTYNKIYYVSNYGSDSNDGISPNSPFLTIAKAILTHTATITTECSIFVFPGTYNESITTKSYLNLYGFQGDYINPVVEIDNIIVPASIRTSFTNIKVLNTFQQNSAKQNFVTLNNCFINNYLQLSNNTNFGTMDAYDCYITTFNSTVSSSSLKRFIRCNISQININNANFFIQDCKITNIIMASGIMNIENSLISSTTTPAVTVTGGTLNLNSVKCYYSNTNNALPLNLSNCTFSYINSNFDYSNSTFSSVTFQQTGFSQFDQIYIKGSPADVKFIGNSTKTTAFTASDFSSYTVDTTSGIFAVTLPTSGIDGNKVLLTCVNNSFYINPLTITSSATNKINGYNASYLCSKPFSTYICIYNLVQLSWSITTEHQSNFNEIIYTQSGLQVIPSNVETALTIFITKVSDPGAYWNSSISQFITPVPGLFQIQVRASFDANNNGIRYISVKKNGVNYMVFWETNPSATNPLYFGGTCIVRLANGDDIQFKIWQNSGGNLSTSNSAQTNQIQICRIGS